MANSILRLIFPFSNYTRNEKEKSTQQEHNIIEDIATNKNSQDQANVPWTSQEAPISTNKNDSKSICLLISDHANIDPIHNRNLLFQCALTVAANDNSNRTAFSHKGTVTIITPRKWDKLPECYVLGMRIGSDNIEQTMMSNRIQFVYPKTYEELIVYLTSLHSTNQKSKEMYILEDLDYFLSTNEKQYIQTVGGYLNDTTHANDTTINLGNNQITQDKQGQMLTKLLAVTRNFLAYELKTGDNDTHLSEDMLSPVDSNKRTCKFLINVTTSFIQIAHRQKQLKMYMWVDEVWVMSTENAKDTSLNAETIKQNRLNRKHNLISCTYVHPNSLERKLIFYYDIGLKSYVFKTWDIH